MVAVGRIESSCGARQHVLMTAEKISCQAKHSKHSKPKLVLQFVVEWFLQKLKLEAISEHLSFASIKLVIFFDSRARLQQSPRSRTRVEFSYGNCLRHPTAPAFPALFPWISLVHQTIDETGEKNPG